MKIIFKYFPQAKFPADFFPAESPELPAKMHRKTACCGTSAPRRLPPSAFFLHTPFLSHPLLPPSSASSSLIRFFLPHPPSFPSPGPPHRSARCLTFQRRCPFPRCRALRPRPSSHTAILLLPSSFSPGRPFSPIHCRPVPDIPLPARSFPGIPSLHASPIPERPRPLPAGEPPRPPSQAAPSPR